MNNRTVQQANAWLKNTASPKKGRLNIDWEIHYVIDVSGIGGICNCHTHGMGKYNHLDFQIVFPAKSERLAVLLNTIGLMVQRGQRFEPGDYPMDNGVFTAPFRICKARETGRDVLRIILCDPNYRFPENPLCADPYKYQEATGFFED